MAVIESGLITEFYNQYRRNQNRSRDIEAGLVKASDRSSWVEKLAEKSEFLRNTYAYNEERLSKLIYPFVREGKKLDMETADEFFINIYSMTLDSENDSLLTTEMLLKLQEFYKGRGVEDKWLFTTYMLGLTYNDKSNDISIEKARDCFETVASMSDKYCDMPD